MIHGRFTRKSTEPITKGPTKQSNGWAVIVANVSLVIDIYSLGGRERHGYVEEEEEEPFMSFLY